MSDTMGIRLDDHLLPAGSNDRDRLFSLILTRSIQHANQKHSCLLCPVVLGKVERHWFRVLFHWDGAGPNSGIDAVILCAPGATRGNVKYAVMELKADAQFGRWPTVQIQTVAFITG